MADNWFKLCYNKAIFKIKNHCRASPVRFYAFALMWGNERISLSGLFWLSISCLAIVSASIINMAMSNRLFCPVIAAVRLPVVPHLVVVVAAAFYCALCIVHYYSLSYCSSASAFAFPCLPQLESMSTSISLVSTNYKCIMYYDRSPAAHAKLRRDAMLIFGAINLQLPMAGNQSSHWLCHKLTTTTESKSESTHDSHLKTTKKVDDMDVTKSSDAHCEFGKPLN